MSQVYDPIKFIQKIELFTVAIIGSFVTMKLLNAIYDNLYEPAMEIILDANKTNMYYVKFGKYYMNIGTIFKEFIKWFVLIILLMFFYNFITKNQRLK